MTPANEDQLLVREKKWKRRRIIALASVFSLVLLGAFLFSNRLLEPTASVFSDPNLPAAILHPSVGQWRPDAPHDSLIGVAQAPMYTVFGNESLSSSGISDGGHAQSKPSPSPSPSPAAAALQAFQLTVSQDVPPTQSPAETSGEPKTSGSGKAISLPQPSESSGRTDDDGGGPSPIGQLESVAEDGNILDCDFYSGTWVKDEKNTYRQYQPWSCPYVDKAFACQENGRRDIEYMKWRWKPDGCKLPRFNASAFLERIRGRTVMFIGDSISRNQFESMLCLLREALPDKSKMFETSGYKLTKGRGNFVFQFVDHNCTVEFVRSQYLVRRGTRANPGGKSKPILRIDQIDKSSARWKHADILVFNTGHWWTHKKTSRGKDYYQEGDTIYPKLDHVVAYKKALRTWGDWINSNMNPRRNMIFFRGYANAHYRGGDWDSGGTCNGETEPAFHGAILDSYPWQMRASEEVIQEIRFPVVLLNVTRLTNFRKDGHPSDYGDVYGEVQQAEGTQGSPRKQDCNHWCLPGVPDAWNELIYAHFVKMKAKDKQKKN